MTFPPRFVEPPIGPPGRGRARPGRVRLGMLIGLAVAAPWGAPLVAIVVPQRAQATPDSRAESAPQPGAAAAPAVARASAASAVAQTSQTSSTSATSPMSPMSHVPPALPEPGRIASARVRHLQVDGLDRSYLVQPAPGARGAGRLPVVVLLHGAAQTALDAWRETSLPTLAAQDGFLVVAPQAVDRRWNDARGATVDDVRFLRAVIADAIARDHGDPSAVFMVGVGSGGFMAMRFACDAGEVLRAGASMIAALPVALARDCKSPRPLPWLAIAGTDDPQIPFAGRLEGALRHGQAQPALASAPDSFRFWADRAGCAAAIVREPLTDPARDERHRWAERLHRSACVAGQVSALVVLHGSGHVVPGSSIDSRLIERGAGPAAPELDGGTLVWDHFKATLLK